VRENTLPSQSGFPNIRAVILDYGEVLCYPPAPEAIDRMARIFHVNPKDYAELYARSRGPYDRGDVTPADYWSTLAESVGASIDDEVIENLRRWDVEMWSSVNADMLEWADRLRTSGLKTAILSNMETDMVRHMRKTYAWLNNFDCQIFSCEVRLIKPDQAIYRHCLASLGVPASEALFLDDREANVEAARTEGLTAIRFGSVRQLRLELERMNFTILPTVSSGPIVSDDCYRNRDSSSLMPGGEPPAD
jgi:putative hydrolase of the HAD superfamily